MLHWFKDMAEARVSSSVLEEHPDKETCTDKCPQGTTEEKCPGPVDTTCGDFQSRGVEVEPTATQIRGERRKGRDTSVGERRNHQERPKKTAEEERTP
ncbi:hypothetical protein NDU88_003535 [Pleurodeles waltl]|uniref:Uncharacterized protein n=1 Tax=Pleurodeles waltl TaxID=8319 RepID=A0AAV7T6R7_PLEWA|nr:hypothetical protein NDU88_003535 [Pleurodeles waltl]